MTVEAAPSGANAYRIAVVPGDGIVPDVCAAAITVIEAALGSGHKLRFDSYPAGTNC